MGPVPSGVTLTPDANGRMGAQWDGHLLWLYHDCGPETQVEGSVSEGRRDAQHIWTTLHTSPTDLGIQSVDAPSGVYDWSLREHQVKSLTEWAQSGQIIPSQHVSNEGWHIRGRDIVYVDQTGQCYPLGVKRGTEEKDTQPMVEATCSSSEEEEEEEEKSTLDLGTKAGRRAFARQMYRHVYNKGYTTDHDAFCVKLFSAKGKYDAMCASTDVWVPQVPSAYAVPGAPEFDLDTHTQQVDRILRERAPVLIRGKARYNKDALEEIAGYRDPAYDTVYQSTGMLPPNVAICMRDAPFYINKQVVRVGCLYNAIGIAMEVPSQLDYKWWTTSLTKTPDMITHMRAYYEQVITGIFAAALKHGMACVVMSYVGCNNFALLFPGGPSALQSQVFAPAFAKVWAQMAKDKLDVRFMGTAHAARHTIAQLTGVSFTHMALFPQLLDDVRDISKTMIVNAADGWALAGNGNNSDDSLDGYIGRLFMAHLMGWTVANPSIVENINFF